MREFFAYMGGTSISGLFYCKKKSNILPLIIPALIIYNILMYLISKNEEWPA